MSDADSSFQLPQRRPLVLIISGPSGVGKDALIQAVMKRSENFHFVVTMTSRPKRENEAEGVDYLFVTREQFEELIDNNGFIEYSRVYEDYKGVPKYQVQAAMASGKDILMRVDVQGAEKLHKILPEAVLVFLAPPSREEWLARFLRRNTESEAQFNVRRVKGESEMRARCWFDYIVVNHEGRLEEAVDDLLAIVQAEHLRALPRMINL